MSDQVIQACPTGATVTSSSAVIGLSSILALAGTVAITLLVATVPAAELTLSAIDAVRRIPAICSDCSGYRYVTVIAGFKGKRVATLHVNDYGQADADFVRSEGADLVGVIDSVGRSINMIGECAGEEESVGMIYGAQVGVYGKTT